MLIIPGNHDIPRKNIVKLLIDNTDKVDFFDEKKFEEHWETFESRFKSFNNFVKDVTTIDDYNHNSFGGSVRSIKTEKGTIKFLLLNSSWACVGDNDYKNIMVGRWQLEGLKKLSEGNKDADLTIGLMHHPFDWLDKRDMQFVMDYISTENCLPVDVMLHGHIHNAFLEQTTNPDRSIKTFVTGIGYPEKGSNALGRTKISSCRYTIYQFNVDNGTVDVFLRISNEKGIFVADTRLYNAGSENGTFTIYYKSPLVMKEQSSGNSLIAKSFEPPYFLEVDSVLRVPEWVGRDKEISIIKNRKLSALAITGMGGQGKSGLASEILRRFSRGDSAPYNAGLWIDCRELPDSLHYKVIQTLEKISGGIETASLYRDEKLEDTTKRLIKHLTEKKLLIVFDNIDAYVKADTEGPTIELKPFFDSILNTEHNSLVIFTCRPALIHESAAFHHIRLSGLSMEEGIEFFRKRNIDIGGVNRKYCEKVIELTNGHPWWMGLIAGQISSHHQTLKICSEKLKMGDVPERERIQERIQEYFKNVWLQLNKDRKKLLRYLVESHRPLTEYEIALLEMGPNKVYKELRRLERLGLAEQHEGISENIVYQVHPLLREFIHGTFSRQSQEPYVQRILYIFLPRGVVDILFSNNSNLDSSAKFSPDSLVDSIETCLNSRNPNKALGLLEQYKFLLHDNGFHHQYQSLACRVLDSIEWEGNNIFTRNKGVSFLQHICKLLANTGENKRCYIYLKKYETSVEVNSLAYLNYLSLACSIAWQFGNYGESIELSIKFEKLAEKLETTDGLDDVKHTRALSMRDSGDQVQEALNLFTELKGEYEDYAYLGNCARCYYKLGDYTKAESLLKMSLIKVLQEEDYHGLTNLGFAYLWLVEIMYQQEKYKVSKSLYTLVEKVWTEYAPGLLHKVHEIELICSKNESWKDIQITYKEAKEVEQKFLSN